MVAIALYRGNLHRVPNTPRRWPPPPRGLSASQFKSLLRRRSLALSRLHPKPNQEEEKEERKDEAKEKVEEKPVPVVPVPEEEVKEEVKEEQEEEDQREEGELLDTPSESNLDLPVSDSNQNPEPNKEEEVAPAPEASVPDKEQRKMELEKKLEELNQKKHNLVQMLKQILNAEEEMKRRMSESTVTRAPGSVLSESGPDVSTANRTGPPRISVDVNFGNDLVGESDPGSTQSAHTRPFSKMPSPSPSSGSLSRSPFSHTPRGSHASNSLLGNPLTSPSRFAPPSGLGHASSLPPLLPLPGTNMASSPSPAASGSMPSLFRDSRFGSSS